MISSPPRRLVDDPDFDFGEALRDVAEETRLSPEALERNRPPVTPAKVARPLPGSTTAAALAAIALAAALLLASRQPDAVERIAAAPAPITTVAAPDVSPRELSEAPSRLAHAPTRTPAPRTAIAPATPPALEETPPRESRRGTLADELRLLESAREAARRGEHDAALASLDRLEREYPATRLAPEARLQRVRVLVAASRAGEAIPLLQELAESSRRPDLFRWAGDLHLAAHDCERASASYERAGREGLDEEDARTAKVALSAACGLSRKNSEGAGEERE